MQQTVLSSHLLVADLLAYSPLVAAVLVELRTDCPGCSMTRFCTLDDLCRQYKMDLQMLINTIQERLVTHASN